MSSIRSYGRRVGSLFAVAALVLATITPGLVPTFVSAASLTERSIKLSSSSAQATGVSYEIKFTPETNAGAFVIDFCGDTPLIGATCTPPVGFSVAGASTASAGWTRTAVDANTNILVGTITATEEVTVVLAGVTNPDEADPLYVRIVTYADGTDAAAYTSTNITADAIDQASAAVSITDTIGVSGAVLESMTFCVAGPTDNAGTLIPTVIGDGCTNTTTPGQPLPAPTLKLGEKTGDVVALDATKLSEGSIYSQISTNAASGAIVNLKSGAAGCGGLIRAGTGTCDIAPAQNVDVVAGVASFGAKLSLGAADADGELGAEGIYNALTFALTYDNTLATGVTSTYGDPFFNTNGAPASNKNLEVIFGASVAPNTPAGLYSADLSLIATGKF